MFARQELRVLTSIFGEPLKNTKQIVALSAQKTRQPDVHTSAPARQKK
jgi:hypothetical protein